MKPIERSLESSSCFLAHALGAMKPRQFDQRLSEEDILYLQDIFLSNGIHVIKVPTISWGRALMYRLLQSLHYFHTIACLTAIEEPPLKKSVFDIHRALQLTKCDEDDVEHFFTERFFADFLWLELTSDLVELPVFGYALDALDELALGHHIPIIALSYDCMANHATLEMQSREAIL